MTALIITATPLAGISLSAYAATTTIPAGSNLKAVTEKGSLDVTVPDNISDTLVVNAYEMLQLVIPKDSNWVAGTPMNNDVNSKNIYVVTDPWANFFSTAKNSYTTSFTNKDDLYLTYDTSNNRLVLSDTQPAGNVNVNFIKIDNAAYDAANSHIGKLDTTFFEADIISRIISSTNNDETAASAAMRAKLPERRERTFFSSLCILLITASLILFEEACSDSSMLTDSSMKPSIMSEIRLFNSIASFQQHFFKLFPSAAKFCLGGRRINTHLP